MVSAVDTEDFSDATLVLAGHGSTRHADSAAPVRQHAAELRRRRMFAEVREGFWQQEPRLAEAVATAATRRVFVAPLFISEGYFSEEVLPRELGFRGEDQTSFSRRLQREGRTWFYCHPVGTHESMTRVLLARARTIVARYPFPRAPRPEETTLFLAGHGTGRNEDSRAAVERQAVLIRSLNVYAGVHAVFMEEEPRIGDCYLLAATRHLIMVPFFISDGLHVREDIPLLLGESERQVRERLQAGQPTWRNPTERQGKLLWYTPAIGTEPQLAEVILERVRQAAAGESTRWR